MEQQNLFELYREPLARKSDPPTSHQAAASLVDEGKLGNMQRMVLALIREHPGLTGSELDEISPGRKGQAHKRLKELERKNLIYAGEIRTCTISRQLARAYWPT